MSRSYRESIPRVVKETTDFLLLHTGRQQIIEQINNNTTEQQGKQLDHATRVVSGSDWRVLLSNMTNLVAHGFTDGAKFVAEWTSFHLGRAADTSYWERLESTAVVMDFVYRQMVSPMLDGIDKIQHDHQKKVVHPCSIALKQNCDFVVFSKNVKQKIKYCYEYLKQSLAEHPSFRIVLDTFETVEKKYRHYKLVIQVAKSILIENTDLTIAPTPSRESIVSIKYCQIFYK